MLTMLIKKGFKEKGKCVVKAMGNSMFPTIKNGDSIELVTAEYIDVGEIVLCEYKNLLFLHRIVEINNDIVITKGDNHK